MDEAWRSVYRIKAKGQLLYVVLEQKKANLSKDLFIHSRNILKWAPGDTNPCVCGEEVTDIYINDYKSMHIFEIYTGHRRAQFQSI